MAAKSNYTALEIIAAAPDYRTGSQEELLNAGRLDVLQWRFAQYGPRVRPTFGELPQGLQSMVFLSQEGLKVLTGTIRHEQVFAEDSSKIFNVDSDAVVYASESSSWWHDGLVTHYRKLFNGVTAADYSAYLKDLNDGDQSDAEKMATL